MQKEACITMSRIEVERYEFIQKTLHKELKQREVAQILGVSMRQIKRWVKAVQSDGQDEGKGTTFFLRRLVDDNYLCRLNRTLKLKISLRQRPCYREVLAMAGAVGTLFPTQKSRFSNLLVIFPHTLTCC